MKINQKFAKRTIIAATLTAGVIGFNSVFNEAQASSCSCPTHKIWDGKGCSWNDLSNCAG